MTRIFSSLSIASLMLILLALTYGMLNGDYNGLVTQLKRTQLTNSEQARQRSTMGAAATSDQARMSSSIPPAVDQELLAELRRLQWHTRNHMLLGVFAAVVAALVQCVGVTYFIGTGRWFREVVEAYGLDAEIIVESSKIKRSSFPFAMLGITTILMIAALGAASDPGTLRENTAWWVAPHYTAAICGVGVIAFALYRQARAIQRNQELIDDVMQRVHDARVARQLEV